MPSVNASQAHSAVPDRNRRRDANRSHSPPLTANFLLRRPQAGRHGSKRLHIVPTAPERSGGACPREGGKSLLVQCMVEKEILAFRFDGAKLEKVGSVKTNGGPAGIRTAEP